MTRIDASDVADDERLDPVASDIGDGVVTTVGDDDGADVEGEAFARSRAAAACADATLARAVMLFAMGV